MGLVTRNQLKRKQTNKRRKKRNKLIAKGVDINTVYSGKIYIGSKDTTN